ncbi:aspartic peptidase domain-containing protein, partial [Calycina marina]
MRIGLIQCGCILRLAVLLSCEVVAAPIEEWLLGEWLAPRDTIPAPIVIAASQDWDGNDGPWSSFPIQIGTPAQTIKVFPATSGYKTMAVMPGGCIATDPSSCFSDRGGFYTPSLSTTQVNNTADPTTNIYPIALDERLGYLGKAALGFDTVTLGWPGSRGPTLINQTVGGFITKERYFGSFGLLPRAANFTATFDHPIPSYMQNLVSQKKIPSTSWSYTAGNQYRLNKVLGSLVLGGYDSSKFVPNDVIFPFNDIDELDLTVQLESIKMTDGNTSLLEKSIPAMVDSSEAMIWLPDDACILFEKAFGLTWNDTLGYYLLSGEQHATLVAQDPTLVFTLGNLTAGATVDITLPYSAFNLNVSSPIVPTTQYYFPLQRAANDTQYTLGRTFFQEAYITADYDRRTFTVSQASWVAGATSKIVSILPPTSESMTTSGGDSTANSTENAGKAKKVPVAAIAGGAGGGAILLIFAALLAFFCCIRPR